ncbi:hypothetical protein CHUAL_014151 [Chamberlinius hualienensis]
MQPENGKERPIKKKKSRTVIETNKSVENEAGSSSIIKSDQEVSFGGTKQTVSNSVSSKPVRERKRTKSHHGSSGSNTKSETKSSNKGAVSESVISSSQESLVNKNKSKPNVVPPLTLSLTKAFQSQSNSGNSLSSPTKVSQTHSKHAIKYALKQQQKRQKKNATMATTSGLFPRIIVKPLPPMVSSENKSGDQPSASSGVSKSQPISNKTPALAIKNYRKRVKKLGNNGTADNDSQRNERIDLVTPHSILVNTNIRGLLTRQAFSLLPVQCQEQLMQLLPAADRGNVNEAAFRLNNSVLNNEFFARACKDWQSRLAKGEFVPENRLKLKAEEEKDQAKIDPWKTKHFEPIWGQKPQESYAKSLVTENANVIKASSSRRKKTTESTLTNELISQVNASLSPRVVIPMLKQRTSSSDSLKTAKEVETELRCKKRVGNNENEEIDSKKCRVEVTVENQPPVEVSIEIDKVATVTEESKKEEPSKMEDAEVIVHTVDKPEENTIKEQTSSAAEVTEVTPTKESNEKENVVSESLPSSVTLVKPSSTSFVTPLPLPQLQPRMATAVTSPIKLMAPSRSNGGVNLERSRQICLEVLNSSQNRNSVQDKFKSKINSTMGTVTTASANSNNVIITATTSPTANTTLTTTGSAANNQVVIIPAGYSTNVNRSQNLHSTLVLTPVTNSGNINSNASILVSIANRPPPTSLAPLILSNIDPSTAKITSLTSLPRPEMVSQTSSFAAAPIHSTQMESQHDMPQYVLSVNQANQQQQFLFVSQKQPLLPRSPPRASSAPPLAEMTAFGNNPPVRSSSVTTDNVSIDNRCSISMLKPQQPITSSDNNIVLRSGTNLGVVLGLSATNVQPATATTGILVNPVSAATNPNRIVLPAVPSGQQQQQFPLRLPLLSVVGIPDVLSGTYSNQAQHQLQQTVVASFPSATLQPNNGSTTSSCVCNLKAMVACKKCGAFCHDDCIGPLRLCVTCLIR